MPVAGPQHADHAGYTDTTVYLDPPVFQLPGHDVGGAVFFQPKFRMGVDIPADGGQFVLVAADTIERIAPSEVSKAAAAIAVMVYVVAEMPERLPK